MLATEVPVSTLPAWVTYPSVVMQEKLDGQRFLAEVFAGRVTVYGRDGQTKVTHLPAPVLADLARLTGRWVLDGEIMPTGRLALFDLAGAATLVDWSTPFATRHEVLTHLVAAWAPVAVDLVPVAVTEGEKAALVARVVADAGEGVIIRRAAGQYRPGVHSDEVLKVKYVHDLEAIVTALDVDGKDSCELTVLDTDGSEPFVVIGNASTYGKRVFDPAAGGERGVELLDVVTVRYRKVGANRRLVEPRIVAVRFDKGRETCLIEQDPALIPPAFPALRSVA